MRILAIDTSCDESCAAIIDTSAWKLLGEAVHSHIDAMKKFGGVVPEIASREHLRGLPLAVDEALTQAELTLDQIDWIAVTHRPGLIGALLVGVSYAKTLALSAKKPFTVMDHIEGHIFSPLLLSLEEEVDLKFPWIDLVVSGGHTELFYVESVEKIQWLGGTLDDAAGEAFDKVAKLLKIAYPGGPRLDKWVREEASDADRKRHAFPRSRVGRHQFSFSGFKTAVALEVQKNPPESEKDQLALAASAQEAIIDALVMKVKMAQEDYPNAKVVVTGGVACNSRLREKLPQAHFPKPKHCTDNAAMIALLAGLKEREGLLAPSGWDTQASARGQFV